MSPASYPVFARPLMGTPIVALNPGSSHAIVVRPPSWRSTMLVSMLRPKPCSVGSVSV